MIADLKPYTEYKETGMLWVGKMPIHWSQRRIKFLFKERVQKGFLDEPLLAATQTKGVVRKEDYGVRTVIAMKDLHLLKLVEIGDFVISLRSFEGGIEVAYCRGIISPAYTILAPRPEARRSYYTHFFKSRDFISCLSLFVTGIREGQNIDYERLSRAYMPLPPADEQDHMGGFLDNAHGRLEKAIRAKRKVITLLNEQKQAIIHRAVTLGLDPEVSLKPSGIPWLGDIPAHWEIAALRSFARKRSERNAPHLPLLSVVREKGIIIRDRTDIDENHNFIPDDLSNYKVVNVGDLAINKMKAWQGSLGISDHTGIVSPAYYVCKLDGGHHGAFLHLLLRSRRYVEQYLMLSEGVRTGQWDLDFYEFLKLPVLLPPLAEQVQIAKIIRSGLGDIDATISRLEREISLLREYRTRLVADVVTGKLDVREAARSLPEDKEESVAESEPDIDEAEDLDIDQENV